MASPDLRQYTDLTIYDKDTQDIYDMAVAVVQASLPEWVPQEGNTEVILIEALAQEVMETIYAINRLPGAVMQTLLQLYGVFRDEGAQPTTTIQINLSDTLGHEVPEGTRFMLNLSEGQEPVVFSTDAGVVVAPGSKVATVTATGDRFTDDANGVAAGQSLELLDAVPYVDYAVTTVAVTGGAPEEADQDWLDRGVQRMSRLVDTLTVPSHFTSAAMEYQFVERATTLDNFDATAGSGSPGSHPGHVSVAVYGDGRMLTSPEKDQIDADMELKALANLSIHIFDPTMNSQNVTATVQAAPGYTSQQAIDGAKRELQNAMNPMVWDWSTTLYRNDVVTFISRAPEVARVMSVTVPASDVTLSGYAPLVNAGTLNITAV